MSSSQITASAGGSDRPRLAVAYDSMSSAPMELAGIVGHLCDLVWVAELADPALGSMGRLIGRLGTVVDIAGRADAEVADELRGLAPTGVVSFSDTMLRCAAGLADRLGLPGNPPDVVDRLTDKREQRAALAAAGLPGPRSVTIPTGTTPADVVSAAGGLRFPVVLKPARGDSSRDVVATDDADELLAAAGAIAEHAGGDTLSEEFLVEEFLLGRDDIPAGLGAYVSVEMIAVGGDHVPLAITGKFPPAEPFRETGNFMPHHLPLDEADAVVTTAQAAAAALGVRSGVLHVEIKLTPDGPRVIEVNGRVGGGAIDPLYARRHGVSLTELATRVALGLPVDVGTVDLHPSAGPFDYEFFLQPPTAATRLESIGGIDTALGTAGTAAIAPNRSPGDALDWRRGSQGYVLRATGVAPDLDALGRVPERVTEAVRVTYG